MARTKSSKSDSKSTLYCSFCGKSEHEIRKLIAGPTVFICDECVELCDDIIWDGAANRILIKVKIPATSSFDDVLYGALSKIVEEEFGDIDLRYECRTTDLSSVFDSQSNVAVFSAARVYGAPNDAPNATERKALEKKYQEVKEELSDTLVRLSVANAKFIHASKRADKITGELTALREEYLDHLREISPVRKRPQEDLRVVMFLDVSGFSTMSFERRQEIVDMLRGITPVLLDGKGASEVNMWGDAIVANFTDINHSIESAIRFIRHLAVESLDVRIGMAWGEVRINFNPTTGRRDVDGEVVNYAARLEPLAPLGGVLLSSAFGGLDIDPKLAELVPVKVNVKKAFGPHAAGDEISAYQLKIVKN